jgi:dinuclear metal center YbgI/SA1388 family protein
MPLERHKLMQYLNDYLKPQTFSDYTCNGLQVEGKAHIQTLVTGVTASQALIDAAIEQQADAILVHHGYFWKNEPDALVGMKHRRIKALIQNDINLLAYHLPLDAHAEVGNNVQLGHKLGLQAIEVSSAAKQALLWTGKTAQPLTTTEFAALIERKLDRAPLTIVAGDKAIETVAWCTGGAQDYIDLAAELGVDAFISGEASERTYHSAIEQGVHYFGAGHHATERYGVQALGAHLQKKFNLNWLHIDIDNPI